MSGNESVRRYRVDRSPGSCLASVTEGSSHVIIARMIAYTRMTIARTQASLLYLLDLLANTSRKLSFIWTLFSFFLGHACKDNSKFHCSLPSWHSLRNLDMPSSIQAVCLAIVLAGVGFAQILGIPLSRITLRNPKFDRDIYSILFFEATLIYFSDILARKFTDKPKSFPGDAEGLLNKALLDDARDSSQKAICLTACLTSILLIVAKASCIDGKWTAAAFGPDDAIWISVLGTVEGTYFFFKMLGK